MEREIRSVKAAVKSYFWSKKKKKKVMKYVFISFLFVPWLKIIFVFLLSTIDRIKQVV